MTVSQLALFDARPTPSGMPAGYRLVGVCEGVALLSCEGCGAFEQPIPNAAELPRWPHTHRGEGERCPFEGAS